jgi:hypothetical protein
MIEIGSPDPVRMNQWLGLDRPSEAGVPSLRRRRAKDRDAKRVAARAGGQAADARAHAA